jgi:hypothetical protein
MPGMPQLPTQLPTLLLFLGGGAIFLGMLLFLNEWLLRWLVASLFCVVGAVLVLTGLRAKRMLG